MDDTEKLLKQFYDQLFVADDATIAALYDGLMRRLKGNQTNITFDIIELRYQEVKKAAGDAELLNKKGIAGYCDTATANNCPYKQQIAQDEQERKKADAAYNSLRPAILNFNQRVKEISSLLEDPDKDNSEALPLIDTAIEEIDKFVDDSYLSDLLFTRCALVSEVDEYSAEMCERAKTLFQDNPEKLGLLLFYEGGVTGSSKTLNEAFQNLKRSTTSQGLDGLEDCSAALNAQISSEIAKREALCADDLGALLKERKTRELEKIAAYLRFRQSLDETQLSLKEETSKKVRIAVEQFKADKITIKRVSSFLC